MDLLFKIFTNIADDWILGDYLAFYLTYSFLINLFMNNVVHKNKKFLFFIQHISELDDSTFNSSRCLWICMSSIKCSAITWIGSLLVEFTSIRLNTQSRFSSFQFISVAPQIVSTNQKAGLKWIHSHQFISIHPNQFFCTGEGGGGGGGQNSTSNYLKVIEATNLYSCLFISFSDVSYPESKE